MENFIDWQEMIGGWPLQVGLSGGLLFVVHAMYQVGWMYKIVGWI